MIHLGLLSLKNSCFHSRNPSWDQIFLHPETMVRCLHCNYRPRTKYEGRYCFHRYLSVHISGGGGYHIPDPGSGVPQVQVGGVPYPGGGGGITPSQAWVPPSPHPGLDRVPPIRRQQHGEHLVRSGRYASCVHAGGLSC